MKNESIKVRVTAADIRHGVAGCGFNCAIARALQRVTKDLEAHVMSQDWDLRVFVHGHSILAPNKVRSFVYAFDSVARNTERKPILPKKLTGDLAPFTFEIPFYGSPEWLEDCYGCGHLFDTAELDDEGYCEECRKPADAKGESA